MINILQAEEIADIMLKLQNETKCHNINFVTPEHVVPQVWLGRWKRMWFSWDFLNFYKNFELISASHSLALTDQTVLIFAFTNGAGLELSFFAGAESAHAPSVDKNHRRDNSSEYSFLSFIL